MSFKKKEKYIPCALMSLQFKMHIQKVGKMYLEIYKKMTHTNLINVLASKTPNELRL